MSRWLICLLALLVAGPAAAADVTALELADYGLFRAKVTGSRATPMTVTGRTNSLGDIEFYSNTDRIPAKPGIRFGTRFRAKGSPAGQTATMRAIWRFPEPGIRNNAGKVFRESIFDIRPKVGSLHVVGYSFVSTAHIICGEWIQEIWLGERKLLSQTFHVEGCGDVPVSGRLPATTDG